VSDSPRPLSALSSDVDRVAVALADPGFYPERPGSVEVHETHISRVFLAGDRAYKLKKPLVLPFLDYGTAARRRKMCCEEVRLNRRLAPGIYLGVRGVAAAGDGFELCGPEDERAVEFVVEMVRFDERESLANRVARGRLEGTEVTAVARVLCDFHARAARAHGLGTNRGFDPRFDENLLELMALVTRREQHDRLLGLADFAAAFAASHEAELLARRVGGCRREGHGDLRAEHVLVHGGEVQIVDCVEFDHGLRELDVADDLAFLVMDLVHRGAAERAEQLVTDYRMAGGDPGSDALIAYYGVHRALVRAKVALVRAGQEDSAGATQDREEAAMLIDLAERLAWKARAPIAIVVCGVPASGKSHLASALASVSGFESIAADATRKRLAGVAATEHAPDEAYGSAFSLRSYSALGDHARHAVAAGHGAIVDATFRHRSDRDAFRAGYAACGRILYVECVVPTAVLERRARERDARGRGQSDADLAVVMRERSTWEQLDEVEAPSHLILRCDRGVDDIVSDVVSCLNGRRPPDPGFPVAPFGELPMAPRPRGV
jgi:uncharacterized protein